MSGHDPYIIQSNLLIVILQIQDKDFKAFLISKINMSPIAMIANVKPEKIKFVDKPHVKEEIKIRNPESEVIVEQPTKEQITDAKSKTENAFKELRGMMIGQNTEKIETVSEYICCGCCKIETENRYFLRSLDTNETLIVWWPRRTRGGV